MQKVVSICCHTMSKKCAGVKLAVLRGLHQIIHGTHWTPIFPKVCEVTKGIGQSGSQAPPASADGEVRLESDDEWVRGDVHTNTIENDFSLFKRSVVGSYHKVSKKHLDAYLDELEWRFNNRENPYLFRDTLLKLIKSDNLPYEKLAGN